MIIEIIEGCYIRMPYTITGVHWSQLCHQWGPLSGPAQVHRKIRIHGGNNESASLLRSQIKHLLKSRLLVQLAEFGDVGYNSCGNYVASLISNVIFLASFPLPRLSHNCYGECCHPTSVSTMVIKVVLVWWRCLEYFQYRMIFLRNGTIWVDINDSCIFVNIISSCF